MSEGLAEANADTADLTFAGRTSPASETNEAAKGQRASHLSPLTSHSRLPLKFAFSLPLSALKQRFRRFKPNRPTAQIHGVQIPMDAFLILSGLLLFLMAMAIENKTSR
jgi:hypothetical protein